MTHYIVACVLEYPSTILIFYVPVAFAARDQCERRGFIYEVRVQSFNTAKYHLPI